MDYSTMSLAELIAEKKRLGLEIASATRAVRVRRDFLKSTGLNRKKQDQDGLVIQLRSHVVELQHNMTEIMSVKERRAWQEECERREYEARIDQLDAKEREIEEYKNMKANARRPDGKEVYYLYEFDNLKGVKRRLIVMMIREIGVQRFLELRRIANWDERHHNNEYYK